MLYLIGLGLKPSHLTIEGLEALKACDRVYLETYTSHYSTGKKADLEDLIGKAVTELKREEVEQEFQKIFDEAKTKKVALCVFGNPMNATTHLQIILDAHEQKIKTEIIPGLSIFEFVSFTGLERYKFGRTTSIVFHEQDYEPESFYDTILENKKAGLHTICLLDIKKHENKMMDVNHAISLLERIEEKRESSILSESIFVALAGMGSGNGQIKAGMMEDIKKTKFSSYPQTLIVCGKLNEKEIEGLRVLSEFNE
ncbi:MAG TPA: diphthine synthase [archaeon]|nr:diphthine synthase [archaeon]